MPPASAASPPAAPSASAKSKTRLPAVEGLFTMDDAVPQLIGGKGVTQGSYFFPRDLAGRDPQNEQTEEVLLSRTGVVWSYTTASYPPPPPYVITRDPWEPMVIAAVELPEKLVVLGPMTDEVALEDMQIGMEVELVLDVLYSDEEHEYMSWKWKPR